MIAALLSLLALAQDPNPATAPSVRVGEWTLAAAYDVSAVEQLAPEASDFVWEPAELMSDRCGPPKRPDGLGVFEAEAIGSRLTPVLALVLVGQPLPDGSPPPPLTTETLRVAIGETGPALMLHPMVEPRYLAFHIEYAPDTRRYAQLVRTQLEMEACLEHKTGRGWRGHDTARLRQAFLLDEPEVANDPSRKYFGGQLDPIPGLLGAPDACIDAAGLPSATAGTAARGETRTWLIPTDVWGAELRPCTRFETGGATVDRPPPKLRLRTSAPGLPSRPERRWAGVDIGLTLSEGAGPEDARVRVDLSYRGEPLMQQAQLFPDPAEGDERGLVDLLAQLPFEYPIGGVEVDAHTTVTYTVLLIPNWQIVEAIRRLAPGHDPAEPIRGAPVGTLDGVGYVLAHPELLYVQVEPARADADWPNLAGVLRSKVAPGPFGYTTGVLGARNHIVLSAEEPANPQQIAYAQRAPHQSALLLSSTIVLITLLMGLRRVGDLWTRVPEERADYWPGSDTMIIADTEANSPDMEGGGGGE